MVSSCFGSNDKGDGWCKLQWPPGQTPGTYYFTNYVLPHPVLSQSAGSGGCPPQNTLNLHLPLPKRLDNQGVYSAGSLAALAKEKKNFAKRGLGIEYCSICIVLDLRVLH